MTRDQLGACIALEKEGFRPVNMPIDIIDTPIPGMILLADTAHRHLWMVNADGTATDLLAVHAAATDTIRNWQHYPRRRLRLPSFIGDFARLTKLAQAINGRQIKTETQP